MKSTLAAGATAQVVSLGRRPAIHLSFLVPPALVALGAAILLPVPSDTQKRLMQHMLSIALQTASAVTAGLLAWSAARRYQGRDVEGLVWRGASVGSLLWAAGILLYAMAQWSGRARPYPSTADIGFGAAVLIWVLALGAQYQLVRPMLTPWQRTFLWLAGAAIWVGAVGTVLWPIMQSPLDALEKTLDLFYPTFGALLLVLGLAPALVFRGGLVGYSWFGIALGMGCLAAASLAYAHLTWFELYSETHPVNLLRVAGFAAIGVSAAWQRRALEAL
jgi:hypothetical protein